MAHSSLPNIIERSYQLAKSGAYEGVEAIRRQLKAEGYPHSAVGSYIAGPLLQRTLSNLCLEAQGKPKRSPPSRRNRLEM